MAIWSFISFILAFWGFIFFHFGLLGLHFLSFWPFGLSFLHFLFAWAATWGPPRKLPKTGRFLIKFKQILSAAKPAVFSNFWPFGPSFPFILAFWAFISFHFGDLGFISFHFGLLGLHFLSFLVCLGCHVGFPPHKLPKTGRFLIKFKQILSAARPAVFSNFWPFGLHFLSFWPFGPSFPFILAIWGFISFHFGLLGLSFPFNLAFWAFISFHFGLLGLHFLSFWPFGLRFLSFWPFGLSFPFILACWAFFLFILAFWAFISFHCGLLGFIFFILASWAFISFHFALLGLHFLTSSSGLCHPSASRCSLLMALRAARCAASRYILGHGLGSPFGNLKLFAEGPHQRRRGLGGIKVYIGPRGWVHPSVT